MYDETGAIEYIRYIKETELMENGLPASINDNKGDIYYCVKNPQGDVIELLHLRTSGGNQVLATHCKYRYDSWGKLEGIYNSLDDEVSSYVNDIAVQNPFRYRGYQYDSDTGLYYLQSRYYDPDVKRFINADGLISVDQEFLGNNLYTYCGNNPITYVDYTGNRYDVSGNPSRDDAETVKKGIQASQSGKDNSKVQETKSHKGITNSISGQFQEGIVKGSGSITGGYGEVNGRLQIDSRDSVNDGMIGGYAKVSGLNANGKIGIGNNYTTVSLKGVGDGLTATAQAGLRYKNGIGLAAKAKAAVLSGRATIELELFDWQIEFGVSGDLLSVGGEVMIGVFPDEGFKAKAGGSNGLFGVGIVFRVKPAQ